MSTSSVTSIAPRLTSSQVTPFVDAGGRACVLVGLSGEHGTGRQMKVSEATWERLSAKYGDEWIVMPPQGQSAAFVATTRAPPRRGNMAASLADLIARPGRGRVMLVNGDPFDLRDENLVALSERDARTLCCLPSAQRQALLEGARDGAAGAEAAEC